jgi:signal recognition particle receptor subunit beta
LALAQLIGNRFVATVSSLKVTECDFELGGRVRTLVDLPGADRLRAQFWEQLRSGATAVVFWLDSKSIGSNLADVADLLYQVLSDPSVRGRRIPVLIACNKQDAPLAKSVQVIRAHLEKEFDSLRECRLAALDSTSTSTGSERAPLGRSGKTFSFDHLSNRVQFVGISALDKEPHTLHPVREWLRKNV